MKAEIDIIESKHDENRRWDSLLNFYKVVNSIADGVIVTNHKGVVLYVNPAAESIFDKKRKDFLGKQFGFPITLDNATEIEIVHEEGKIVVAEMSVVETVWYDEASYLVSLRDITERKHMEEMIENAAKQWRTTFDSISECVSVHDKDFNVVRVNKAFANIFNKHPKELINSTCYELLHEQNGPIPDCPHLKVWQEKKPVEVELFMSNLGIHAEISVSPVFDDKGDIFSTVHIIKDITERKQAQQIQERLSQQLQVKVNELEAFGYGIAHDMRSPLVSIEGLCRLLRTDIQNENMESVQEDIRLLESAVRKMQQFLNRTLEYSRAGYMIKPTADVDFGKIAEEVITELAEQIHSMEATVSIANTFPLAFMDSMRIKQVLTNLIHNSINYREKTRPLKIEIGHRPSEDEDVFFVRDNGIGIDPSEAEKVFDLFYRGTADVEGSGAGLAIVKRIIDAHGGRIWAEGESGKGTTMCIALPPQRGIYKEVDNGKD